MNKSVNRSACVLLLATLILGCGYPAVDRVTHEYCKALYAICNQQDKERLANFRDKVSQLKDEGELAKQEADWLLDIVETAERGEWEYGMQECREMMEDQTTH